MTIAGGDSYEGGWKDGEQHGTGRITCADGEVIHIKNRRQFFPGVSAKKQKNKRRASKDSEALIKQFREMAETMHLPDMKMPKMQWMETPVLAAAAAAGAEE